MITFPNSFMNANGDEGSAIGHLFWDREIEHTYVEVLQAEDYVLFRLVHESADQRYGFESFRKMREFRVTVAAMPAVTDIIRGGVPEEGEYPSVPLWDEYGEGEIGFALTEHGITIGCALGTTKLLKVRLSNDDTETFCRLLEAFYDDYQSYLERRVFVTATLREWRHVLVTFDGKYTSDLIENAIADSGASEDDHEISIEFTDSYDADRVQEALSCTCEYTVAEWREIVDTLREQRKDRFADKIAVGVGFRLYNELLEDPVGTTERTLIEMTFSLEEIEMVQHACFLAAVSKV